MFSSQHGISYTHSHNEIKHVQLFELSPKVAFRLFQDDTKASRDDAFSRE